MKICYLRGVNLKSKTDSLGDDDCESLEHVIPQALGGILSSQEILSHKANQDLNDAIDIQFTKIFESFSARLEIEKERKTKTPGILAFHLKHRKELILRNGKYCARRPFYDSEKKIIYASREAGDNFKKHLLKKGDIAPEAEVRIIDDIDGSISIPFSLDNKNFKQGVAKIAAGFAAIHKVPRENLGEVIDLKEKKFRTKIIVSPFIPTTEEELRFEGANSKSPHYPAHVLILHGNPDQRLLYCYVELFSTFQWYVLLDANYVGDHIHKAYVHDLLNSTEISYDDYIKSVPEGRDMEACINQHRLLSAEKFIRLSKIDRDIKKEYNHFKFNTLSSFTNRVFLSKKKQGAWPGHGCNRLKIRG